ncbi:hypothetical protein AB0H00_19645 [Nocardia sp. NPDC023852]|uniref:hypothetical protein n=1 Tax=Nocardia sp. NPDC023852 TaxID=3154697 RepID=UPI0033C2775F
MRRFAGTTPGAIGAIVVVSTVLCLIAGLACANQLNGKLNRRDAVLERTEPVAYAAQSLYVALSAADALAAAAFLSGGIESPEVRTGYQQALADAAAALAEATTGASDDLTRRIVAQISAELPAYTGLVESARANNRQGFPVGSAYLREASSLMQRSLLPNAERLSSQRLTAVRADQRDIGALPLTSVMLLLLVLVACGAGSFVLLRLTNRRLNVGLGVAGGAAAIALVWTVGASLIAATSVETGRSSVTSRFEALAQARILAQQARTDETLQLVTRGDISAGEHDFVTHTAALRDCLTNATGSDSAALQGFSRWISGHRRQLAAYEAANYPAAVRQAIGAGADSSATRFADLDREVRDQLAVTRAELREGVDSAGDALAWSPAGTLVLLLVAGGAVVVGLWPRLQEFL